MQASVIVFTHNSGRDLARLDRDGLVNYARKLCVIAHFNVAREREVFAKWVADETVVCQDAAQISMAFKDNAKQIKGFDLGDAVLTGVETRTSSPIRIKRNLDDYQSINTRGLYPTGEGAGYAGGILSAAVDGIEVAEAVALSMLSATSPE